MADQPGDDRAAGERIEVEGVAGGLSLAALRSLLDPSTRDAATIDLDLSQVRVTIPAAALHELVARVLPRGSVTLRENGISVRPGDGSPGLNIGMPDTGVRVRAGSAGIRVETG